MNEKVVKVMGELNVETLLACPVCGNDIGVDMACTFCNRKYTGREGIYILIDKETSGMEWKWDRRIESQKYRKEVMEGYKRMISPKIREAHDLWWKSAIPDLSTLSGIVVDVATGLGMMLEQVLTHSHAKPIATDIDPSVLLSTKRDLERRFERRAFYLATDVKHIALKEGVADHITSFAGLNNIIDPEEVVSELYRILKPSGTALIMASFVEEDTPSADLADDYGFLDAYIEDKFIGMLEENDFSILEDRFASSVIWKENEMDIFPIDGDMVYYHTYVIKK